MLGALFGQQGETRWGIVVAPTLGWMQSSDPLINSNGSRLGLKIGGVGEQYLTDWMTIYGGANFSFSQGGALLHKVGGNLLPDSKLSDKQFNTGDKPLPDDTQIKYSLQMLEVPMGLRYLIGLPTDRFDLYFSFPELNVGLVNRSNGQISALGIDLKDEDIGGDVRALSLAWGVGVGLRQFTTDGGTWMAGLHLQSGLSDITSNDGTKAIEEGGSLRKEKEDSTGTVNALILKFVYFF